jgi:protein involved in polysaccharide export with SLBB domain
MPKFNHMGEKMPTKPTTKTFLMRFFISLTGIHLFLFGYGCSNPVAHIPEFNKGNTTGAATTRVPGGPSDQSNYKIVPYDGISVFFPRHPEYNTGGGGVGPNIGVATSGDQGTATRGGAPSILVRPDGNITLEGVGSIRAAGLTPEELSKVIVQKYSDRMKDPEVVVTIVQFAPRKIYVGGEVKNPGPVLITEGIVMTPMQALFDRGGFTDTAQKDSVILIRDGASGNPQIGRLDVNQAMENAAAEQISLQPNDVLYIPMSGIGRADLWVRQHLREILPMELIGLGSSRGR